MALQKFCYTSCSQIEILIHFHHEVLRLTLQVGPTGAKAFHEFLVRLQLRCTNDDHNHLKELLLKLVYTLAAERFVSVLK